MAQVTEEEIKNSYDKFLNSGKFFDLYPELSGIWEEDKDFWYEEYFLQIAMIYSK